MNMTKNIWHTRGAAIVAILALATLAFALTACDPESVATGKLTDESSSVESGNEHSSAEGTLEGGSESAGSESHTEESESGAEGSEGEEVGTQYSKSELYDQTKAGARLILAYDATSNAFIGIVSNTTARTLKSVRIEIHLSNGIELGPTPPSDLLPGETRAIRLPASSIPFSQWSAHPEVG